MGNKKLGNNELGNNVIGVDLNNVKLNLAYQFYQKAKEIDAILTNKKILQLRIEEIDKKILPAKMEEYKKINEQIVKIESEEKKDE